jgi:hypothetical protein
MDPHRVSRIAAVLVGAAVLFSLRQVWAVPLYVAIPAAIVVYVATLLTLMVVLKRGTRA